MTEAGDLEPQLAELIRREVVQVPPAPATGLQLWERSAAVGANGGAPAIVDLALAAVAEDPALGERLLAFAAAAAAAAPGSGSAARAPGGRDGAGGASVADAAAVIAASGLDVGGVAVAVALGAEVTGPGALAPLRRKAWRQSLVGALCCARLGERRGIDRREAFVCGLLHDVGRMVALAAFEEILARTHDRRVLSAAQWEAAMNRFHVDVGLVTATRWRLPPSVSTVIASHHRPELAGRHREMAELVLVGDAIADVLEQHARVLPAELAGAVAAAGSDGQRLVDRLVSELPPFIAAATEAAALPRDRAAPPAAGAVAAAGSQIRVTPSALAGGLRPASFPVQVLRSSGALEYRSSYATAEGIAFHGAHPVDEQTLVRLRVAAPRSLETWATVVLCAPEGETFRIEARLYAADPPAQAAWDGFLATVG